jgi:hypothetical protein
LFPGTVRILLCDYSRRQSATPSAEVPSSVGINQFADSFVHSTHFRNPVSHSQRKKVA